MDDNDGGDGSTECYANVDAMAMGNETALAIHLHQGRFDRRRPTAFRGCLRPRRFFPLLSEPDLARVMNAPSTTVQDEIRQSGLRATPARIATLNLLRTSTSPMTHADVAKELAERGIDKATAFRNLNDLTDSGLLRRTELGDHVWRFEAVQEGAKDGGGHPHFLCVDCGTVSCLDDVKLTAGSLRRSSKVGEITEILLRGHCNECVGV